MPFGRRSCRRDHPRVCGEKSIVRPSSWPLTGSPPRVRGKARSSALHMRAMGITPAYAGKSCHTLNSYVCRQDHPRVCGEKSYPPHKNIYSKGSPPRVRGKARDRADTTRRTGITPAYAGKSTDRQITKHKMGDHPRVCGEKYTCAAVRACRLGSPPRMRGKVDGLSTFLAKGGITPAYAGKSHWSL